MGILLWIVFGAIVGWIASMFMGTNEGLVLDIILGIVGAVLGVGLARGMKALNLGMLKEIILSWVITIPSSAVMSIFIFYLLRMFFQQFFVGV